MQGSPVTTLRNKPWKNPWKNLWKNPWKNLWKKSTRGRVVLDPTSPSAVLPLLQWAAAELSEALGQQLKILHRKVLGQQREIRRRKVLGQQLEKTPAAHAWSATRKKRRAVTILIELLTKHIGQQLEKIDVS